MDKEQELRPKQWVLVRDDDDQVWSLDIFSHFVDGVPYPYNCIGDAYAQCIPYRGNEKLLNTSDAPEVKWEPKNGDFIAFGNGQSKVLGIYKERHTDVRLAFFDYVDYYDGKMQYFTWAWLGSKLRPATDEEKESFLSKLHKIGKDWDAENKKIVDYKWRPKDEEDYYCPTYCSFYLFKPGHFRWVHNGDNVDLNYWKRGWVCRTEEECMELCARLNKAAEDINILQNPTKTTENI